MKRNTNGFSFLEILFALSVFSLGILSLIKVQWLNWREIYSLQTQTEKIISMHNIEQQHLSVQPPVSI